MSQSTLLLNLQKQGFSPAFKKSYGTVLKSNSGLAIAYNDGNIEGFIKSNLNESIVTETSLRHKIELLLLIGLGITYFTTDITIVDGVSMEPTYKNYQLIVKTKTSTDVKKILVSKNSIVKFKTPAGDTAIKRVIGVPGDKVELNKATIKINGTVVDIHNLFNNAKSLNRRVYGDKQDVSESFVLKNNQYYLIGDNRTQSTDSREFGPVDLIKILSIVEK
jgi:signal peptidase I